MIYWLSFRSAEAPTEFNEPLGMNISFAREGEGGEGERVMHGRVRGPPSEFPRLPGNEIDLNDPRPIV